MYFGRFFPSTIEMEFHNNFIPSITNVLELDFKNVIGVKKATPAHHRLEVMQKSRNQDLERHQVVFPGD